MASATPRYGDGTRWAMQVCHHDIYFYMTLPSSLRLQSLRDGQLALPAATLDDVAAALITDNGFKRKLTKNLQDLGVKSPQVKYALCD